MNDEDRRMRRSHDPLLATKFQLQRVVEDFELETCILVDEAGNLVETAGRHLEFEEALARETPRLAVGSNCRLLFARLNKVHRVRPNQISACEFRVAGERWYVAAVGAASTMRDVGLYRAVLGIRRIRRAA